MKKNLAFAILAFIIFISAKAQVGSTEPTFTSSVSSFKIVPPLSETENIPPSLQEKEVNNNRWLNFPTNFDAYPKGGDPLVDKNQSKSSTIQGRVPIANFDTAIGGTHTGATPPDPTGAVGPNHFIHAYNSGFVIFNKEGTVVEGYQSLSTIFPGESLGDPIVLYDRYAERFVITQFSNSPNGLLIAVCQGEDPVNDGWYTYRYNLDSFPDYPKYSIWHDAYYVACNKQGNHLYALERDKLIAGDDTAQIVGFSLPSIAPNSNTVFAPLAMNSVGPNLPDSSLPGYVTYLQDDAWSGAANDHIKVWEVELDWNIVSNSTVSNPIEINTTPFDSFTAAFGSGEVPQPGTSQKIDGITGVISYNCNYYNFGSYASTTLNFNVDVNGDNSVLGIRWFELRNNAGAWSIFQEGTYAPNDGLYRFMGSMCMDANGNIGLAYSVGNASTPASLRYTGRFTSSPLGEMPIAEEVIVDGSGAQTNTNRFGDYAHLTLDPVDNQTFWFSSEYINNGGWRTRAAAFKIAPDEPIDVGVINITSPNNETLTANQVITVEIFNFGTEAQSNIPVTYQIDGGNLVSETFSGTLNPSQSATYTFTETADMSVEGQTYSITSETNLANDANESNDPYTKSVTNLPANDIGVIAITSPNTGTGLGTEAIAVTIENFGGQAQSNFNVSYDLNGTVVTEQVTGPLNVGETISYTFSQTADFSTLGTYQLSATTSLVGDSDISNDSVSKIIFHSSCTPASTSCNSDGIKKFVLGTINVDDGGSGCNSTGDVNGYSDRTNLSTDLDRSEGNNTHVLQAQHNWTGGATTEQLSVWVDFNDNGVFETSEQLIMAENYSVAGELNDFDLVIPTDAPLGSHILRARGLDPTGIPGNPNDPCAPMQYGETQDYTVNIVDTSLSIDEFDLNNSDLIVTKVGEKQFEVTLKSQSFREQLVITMHNILGQKLVKNRVFNENGIYTYNLNLNGLASGVYIIRLGNNNFGKVKRIILE